MDNILESVNMKSPLERSMAINGDFGRKFLKETQIAIVRSQIAEHFSDSPDYQSDTEASVNGEPRRLIVAKHKSELTQKDVIAYPGESLGLGDVVECFGAHWLVTQKDPNTDFYDRGLMELCSTSIRWQNSETLDIVERWAIIRNPYSTNVKESQVLTTLNGKYEVYVPIDEETLAVKPDKRFIIGKAGGKPLVYRLTFPDINAQTYDNQGKGIMVWNLVSEEDVHETDNLDLMIADYVEPTQSISTPGSTVPFYIGTIRGNHQVIVGYSRSYVCDFRDGNDVLKDPSELENIRWSIKAPDEILPYITLEPNGNECRVIIADNDDAINQKFKLRCWAKQSDIASFELECVVM